MEERGHRPRSNAIAVTLEFLHHCLTEYRVVIRVHQSVDSYQTSKEFPLMLSCQAILLRP